ncbi:hypothetical protein [Rhodanobacter sp. T12-5]|uniref:hypothetical protein n=1 Tax=Rhodanobacter sp. T12-5 TaxID=2024611 RepID=UPI0011EE5845|nr:hypothetical protein [Rhodanobacter sp. T12-5]
MRRHVVCDEVAMDVRDKMAKMAREDSSRPSRSTIERHGQSTRRRRGEGSAMLAEDPVRKIFDLFQWRSVHVGRALQSVEICRLRMASCCNDLSAGELRDVMKSLCHKGFKRYCCFSLNFVWMYRRPFNE